jgi:Disulphide bond corrector protein DsbC/AhpC/TSA family
VLRRFSAAYHISYPMLSDKGSVVIREFGILNTNVPPDVTRFYGIPFPGQYLIAPDDTVKDKLFLADYQERPTASEVLLNDFGVGGNSVTVQAAGVSAKVTVSDAKSYSGHRLGVTVAFEVAPGWHIYGTPLPAEYTRTQVEFGDDLIQSESLTFPPSTPIKFEALGQTLPVYSGSFKAVGDILLKQQLKPGDYRLTGTIKFQECNDTECKIPQSVPFALPLKIEPMVAAAPNT